MNALESQVAVVTGAGRGAGEAIACRLAAMGAHVLLVARSAHQLNRVRERILQAGGVATVLHCDLTKASAVAELGNVVAEKHKPPLRSPSLCSFAIKPCRVVSKALKATHDNLRWHAGCFFLRAAPRPFALQVPMPSSTNPPLH
jgi:NAD(P)-dependent dehydrogenase (short-subunit alcohol dehydrogenase family)